MRERHNPFAELELDPKAAFKADFTCWGCGKDDVLIGYKTGDIAYFSQNPSPLVLCSCGTNNLLQPDLKGLEK